MYTEIIWFELAAFILSLIALPLIWKSKYLRIYPFLLLIVVTVEGYFKFFPQQSAINTGTYNIQVPLQYVCYLLILYYAANSKQFKTFMVAAICMLIVFNAVSLIYFTPKNYYNVWGYCFCSLLIIISIIWKFYEMLKNPLEFNFLRNPFFYMLFAYLLFNLTTLPYFSMANWLYHTKKYKSFSWALANVMSVMNYVLYTTYSIAFIWMIRKKDIYS